MCCSPWSPWSREELDTTWLLNNSPLAEDAIRRVPLQAGVAWFWLCLAFRWEQPWEVRPWCKCGGGSPGWAGLSVNSDPTAGFPEGERSSHLHRRPRPPFLTPSFLLPNSHTTCRVHRQQSPSGQRGTF